MTHGACYGYAVDAPFALRYLRDGHGPTLSVREEEDREDVDDTAAIMEWSPDRGDTFRGRLLGEGSRYRLWIDGEGWYRIDVARRSIAVPESLDELRREERLWGVPLVLQILERGDLPLHAAAVEIAGQALLLAAPRRFGKSTLAAALSTAGHRLLSEDISCIRVGDRSAVIPGPAMLRVRRDIVDHLTIRGAHQVGSNDDRIHFAIDPDRRGDTSPVPLGAIVLLHAMEGSPRLERVDARRAVQELWTVSSGLPTPAGKAMCFAGVVATARSVPTWHLWRPLTVESLPSVVRLLGETLERG